MVAMAVAMAACTASSWGTPYNGSKKVKNADGLLDAAVTIVIETRRRPAELRSPDWINRQHGKITAALAHMEKSLNDQPFCMGVNLSLADVAVGCALGFLDARFEEINWRQGHPNLSRLSEKLEARPSFIGTQAPKAV